MTRPWWSYPSPLDGECESGHAGGGRPEYRQERNAGKTSREKSQGAVQGANGSELAEGRVNKRLEGSGDDEHDGGHGCACEKMGSLLLPGDSVSGHRSGGCGDNTNRGTWGCGTWSLWMERYQSCDQKLG